MSDDLFGDCDCDCDCGDCECDCDCGDCECDCDCGDCDCDCDFDCCDCDCNCSDCLPGNNVIILCCDSPPSIANDAKKTNGADAEPDCCCFCCSPRRRRFERRKKNNKEGFCCWRSWWCFAHNDPSPPPRPVPDRDRDLCIKELDKSGIKYRMPGEMRMHRDEQYRSGTNKEPDERSKEYSNEQVKKTTLSRCAQRKEVAEDPSPFSHLGKVAEDERKEEEEEEEEEDTRCVVQDVLPTSHHGRERDHEQYNSDKLEIGQDQVFPGRWSKPVKYDESGRQTKHP